MESYINRRKVKMTESIYDIWIIIKINSNESIRKFDLSWCWIWCKEKWYNQFYKSHGCPFDCHSMSTMTRPLLLHTSQGKAHMGENRFCSHLSCNLCSNCRYQHHSPIPISLQLVTSRWSIIEFEWTLI